MITIIIFIFLTLIFMADSKESIITNIFQSIAASAFFTIIIAAILVTTTCFILKHPLYESRVETYETTVQLQSAKLLNQSENNIKGNFILGCGTIDGSSNGTKCFYAYEVEQNGDIHVEKYPIDITSIRRIDNENPYCIKVYENTIKTPTNLVSLFKPFSSDEKEYTVNTKLIKNILVVPTNSVEVNSFKLNL